MMKRLGYEQYGGQGGDWGSSISRELGLIAGEHLIGVNLNMLSPYVPNDEVDLTDEDKARVQALQRFRTTGSGYAAIQSTRPQTLAYGLTDSPAGQLAWIVEKFGEWTDGDLPDDAVNRDQLLTNVTLYWLTGTAGSTAPPCYQAAPARGPGAPPPSARAPPRGGVPRGDRTPPRRPRQPPRQLTR